MIEKRDMDFYDDFKVNPKPVCLFGTHGPIKIYIAYIKLLKKINIKPYAIVSDDVSIINKSILGIKVISYDVWKLNKEKEQYIILTSGALRYRNQDLNFINECNFAKDIQIWTDFPFKPDFTDYPYPRSWSEQSSWFYDMLYSGLNKYDTNPQQYIESVFQHNGLTLNAGAFVMQDYHSDYVNITNGERYTANQPKDYKNDVYIIGSCIAYGDRCDDSTTIASKLQSLLNKHYENTYCVHNCAAVLVPVNNLLCLLKNLNLKQNDKVLFIDMPRMLVNPMHTDISKNELAQLYTDYMSLASDYCRNKGAELHFLVLPFIDELTNLTNFEKQIQKNIPTTIAKYRDRYNLFKNSGVDVPAVSVNSVSTANAIKFEKVVLVPSQEIYLQLNLRNISFIDLRTFFSDAHEFVEIYSDRNHMAYMGYQYIAYIILNNIFKEVIKTTNVKNLIDFYDSMVDEYILTEEFKEYLDNLRCVSNNKSGNAGIIVMNCNPFTRGHRYLIETAANQVDNLYVLVVEEDKSAFKFKDRFEMVRLGVSDLENVTVLKSGQFVISSLTFPEYFTKDTNKSTKFDATKDLYNFCKYIAPALKSTKRFVGEEPLDIVTNQYNEQMKKYLPENGVELIIIPRKETQGGVISATRGRKYITEKNYEGINMIFPESTVKYLKENGFI